MSDVFIDRTADEVLFVVFIYVLNTVLQQILTIILLFILFVILLWLINMKYISIQVRNREQPTE